MCGELQSLNTRKIQMSASIYIGSQDHIIEENIFNRLITNNYLPSLDFNRELKKICFFLTHSMVYGNPYSKRIGALLYEEVINQMSFKKEDYDYNSLKINYLLWLFASYDVFIENSEVTLISFEEVKSNPKEVSIDLLTIILFLIKKKKNFHQLDKEEELFLQKMLNYLNHQKYVIQTFDLHSSIIFSFILEILQRDIDEDVLLKIRKDLKEKMICRIPDYNDDVLLWAIYLVKGTFSELEADFFAKHVSSKYRKCKNDPEHSSLIVLNKILSTDPELLSSDVENFDSPGQGIYFLLSVSGANLPENFIIDVVILERIYINTNFIHHLQ